VANAETAYVDPSALRSLYVHDDRSPGFCAWRKRTPGALPLTGFGRAELVNSVALAYIGESSAPRARTARSKI
jgi:hypothetical protein